MPITHLTFLIAVLAIAGIWPFAGFFSKDEILGAALESGRPSFFVIGLLVAGFTAFYMSRIYFLTFWGSERTDGAHHAHEAPLRMLLPLCVLAGLSCTVGFLPFGTWIHLPGAVHEAAESGIHFTVAIPAMLTALLGIALAGWIYAFDHRRAATYTRFFGALYRVIHKKFYIDEIYLFVTHRIIFRFIAGPVAWFDRQVVDGGVNATAWGTRQASSALTLLQSGQLQHYAFWFVTGTIAVFGIFWGLSIWGS